MSDIEEVDVSEKQQSIEFTKSNSLIDLPDSSKKLAEGFLSIYLKPLEHIQHELNDLTSKQENCIMQIQLENKKLLDIEEDIELNDLFSTIETYQKKLINVKKEIMTVHERTYKLKKKALRFQQTKQKEILYKEQHRDQGLQKKEQLISGPENL